MSSTFSSIRSLERLVRSLAANLNCSMGVNVSSRTSSCWTKAPNLPKSLALRTLSLHRTYPDILEPGLRPRRCPRMLRNEVLPLPLAPMIAMT